MSTSRTQNPQTGKISPPKVTRTPGVREGRVLPAPFLLHAYVDSSTPAFCDFVLWIDKDHEPNGPGWRLAGRVKLQDEPVATAHAVLNRALEHAQALLNTVGMDPLF